jgi:hypothetical protein
MVYAVRMMNTTPKEKTMTTKQELLEDAGYYENEAACDEQLVREGRPEYAESARENRRLAAEARAKAEAI